MKKEQIDTNSLAHTKWNCKYHIVFAPKYRRKVFYEDKRLEIREILRKLCEWKGVEIVEGEVCPDHIHMLVSIPPKMSISGFMGYLKGKSALLIFQKWGNMKFAYRNRVFSTSGTYLWVVSINCNIVVYSNINQRYHLLCIIKPNQVFIIKFIILLYNCFFTKFAWCLLSCVEKNLPEICGIAKTKGSTNFFN